MPHRLEGDAARISSSLLRQEGADGIEVQALWHDEKATATALHGPEFAEATLLLGVVIAPAVGPLVLDNQIPSVLQTSLTSPRRLAWP
jgi:hypothetical protein